MRRQDIAQSIGIFAILFNSCSPPSGRSSASINKEQPSTDVRVEGCDGPALSLPTELRSMLKPRTGRMVPDDHWADLAERVPGGFAGILYIDGRPTLMLTHPEQAAEAKKALVSDPAFRGFNTMGAQVLKARWDFAQLVDWYNYLVQRTSVWDTSGMVSGDKDERTNRIHFGIQTEAGRQQLIKKLAALHVPCDLVLISIRAPNRLL